MASSKRPWTTKRDRSMNGSLLADTGYFIALYDERDKHNARAQRIEHLLDLHPLVLPWPVLYETIRTRFARKPTILARIDAIVRKGGTFLLDDSKYRESAYRQVIQTARQRPLSLVDAMLRAVIDDEKVPISGLLTFNAGDFHDLCRKRQVELPCQTA